jgi:hypothetical protein
MAKRESDSKAKMILATLGLLRGSGARLAATFPRAIEQRKDAEELPQRASTRRSTRPS